MHTHQAMAYSASFFWFSSNIPTHILVLNQIIFSFLSVSAIRKTPDTSCWYIFLYYLLLFTYLLIYLILMWCNQGLIELKSSQWFFWSILLEGIFRKKKNLEKTNKLPKDDYKINSKKAHWKKPNKKVNQKFFF